MCIIHKYSHRRYKLNIDMHLYMFSRRFVNDSYQFF